MTSFREHRRVCLRATSRLTLIHMFWVLTRERIRREVQLNPDWRPAGYDDQGRPDKYTATVAVPHVP